MNTGILIAGGLCPGVHNLVHDLTLYEKSQGNHVFGFRRGFAGLNVNDRSEMPTLSRETMKLDMAIHSLKDIDRLYCLCGNKSMENAALLALDDRVKTNIIGIAKTMFDDFPGLEAIGSRTASCYPPTTWFASGRVASQTPTTTTSICSGARSIRSGTTTETPRCWSMPRVASSMNGAMPVAER